MGTGASEPCLDVQWSSYNYRWWSPINHGWGAGLRTNLTPVKQHTEMCSCYHCMLIQSIFFHFFLIFSGFPVKFCVKLYKFSQWDRSANSVLQWRLLTAGA